LSSGRPKMRLGWGRKKDLSKGRRALRNRFMPSAPPNIRLGVSRKSYISIGWLAMRFHFLSSVRPKMRVGWCSERDISSLPLYSLSAFWTSKNTTWAGRKSDVSRFRLALRTHLRPSHNKTWERSRKRCYKGRLALRTHFLPFLRPKLRLCEVEKAIIKRVAGPYELIFCLLPQPKCDLVDVERTKFKWVDSLRNQN
jgi:hypothetical protein